VTELSSYEFSPLREGDFTLYRGSGDGLAPILLVAAGDASRAGVARLEQEYALGPHLDAAWAARPLALSHQNGRTVLLLEDPGGQPLDRLLGRPLAVAEFLSIAIPLTSAIGRVHERGLIHKDIKPANILVDAVSGGVWLTGFGIASRLPREHQVPEPPEVIAGTLAYMAPEQTGRMNRSIDSRSDLYALGVTFYELLTGTLPFNASDPMEWVHCHIARRPVPADERVIAIPPQLSAIVMKLLAKTAEGRYQTAAGVEADLRRCLAAWESVGRIDPFPLGLQGASDRLMIPERLYGREREIDALLAAFDRVVANGTTELVLLSGYSGIGKSSVVNELQKVLVLPRSLFASGKCDQYKRDIPYTTLAQALKTLVRQILVKSETEVDQWRCALTEAVGPSGQLIVSFVPELEFVIGKQPAVPHLPPRDAQNRLQLAFRRFIGAFARPEHPLALFLDDLQWLDAATLDLLEHLVTHSEVRHLLLVGAYRDNEISSSHPLLRTLETICKDGPLVQEIVLAPLGLDDVGHLVADAMHCEPERVRSLAQLVQEKTAGNPFFAIQFITALAEEGLLAFDSVTRAWEWSMDRIRAKSYTENVVDLMAGKLKRFSAATQEALKQLACLGHVAEIATLTLVHGQTEEAVHATLWEAVEAGLVIRENSAYKFVHDRIQQASYTLIPEEHRAQVHLRIGRVLAANLTADEVAEHPFDVVNQFNRGATLLADWDERAQVATINRHAARKAKASTAYASACVYLAAGMAMLDEKDWGNRYELMFSLWLERAECEFLTANFDIAEQLIGELLQRAASKVDQAAVYHLKVDFHVIKSEKQQAVASALACLCLFGIDLPAHPTWEQVHAEYETVWQTLKGRPIESLIDLPLMTDPELQAAMQVFSVLTPAAYFTDFHFFCLFACRMVRISMQHGISGASAHSYALLGFILGSVFHRYGEGYRFAKLSCDLVEKHGFIAYQAKAYRVTTRVAFWTQPIATAIELNRVAFRTAIETGDLTSACFSMDRSVTVLIQRNDPLDAVWRESEKSLDFVRKAGFRDMADAIVSQQRFVATMQGRTATFSTFSDGQFDEATFEAQLTGKGMTLMICCFYWILKLKARFLSGDYAEALAAADKAKPLLWAAAAQIQSLDYFYYAALTVAALHEEASDDKQTGWRDLLTAHREQLREWADNYPPTFGDKYALVSAEIARLEGRDADAMRLYDQAIRSAREHGFVQNEGLAHEVAARYFTARCFDTVAHACLREARRCYLRWGAFGKVRQLEQLHRHLRDVPVSASPTTTIGAPVEQLDVATVLKASQTLSGEIVLAKLIEKLVRIAVEHAGAGRGLLILLRDAMPKIVAEATTGPGRVEVTVREAAVTPSDFLQSALHYVMRTGECVVLDDASEGTLYADDEYVRLKHPRSVLCMPIVKQAALVGALYLENNLTSRAFTPDRVAVLEMLASQAAISLENARLYSDLQRSEGFLAQGQNISATGTFGWSIDTGKLTWSEETFRIFQCDRTTKPTLEFVIQRTHPDDRALVQQTIERASSDGKDFDHEYRLLMPDGSVKHVHAVARAVKDASGSIEFVGALREVTAAKQAEEELRHAQANLLHVARVTTLGELTASIAHEVNQPLTGVVTYGDACLRWLDREVPRIDKARSAVEQMIDSARHASDVVARIRALSKTGALERVQVDINKVIDDVIALIRREINVHRVSLRLDLESSLPPVYGDRVQLQQVVMNLTMNGIQAMSAVTGRRRELRIRSREHGSDQILIAVEDVGIGIEAANVDRLFDAFFTTKPDGMGMGLAICRSIIERHGGRIWATRNFGVGSTFEFTLHAETGS
jgi:predicted ATPase/signal transduction histidine kinase